MTPADRGRPGPPDERDFVVLSTRTPAAGLGNTLTAVLGLVAATVGGVGFAGGILVHARAEVLGVALFLAFGGLAIALRRIFAALYPRMEAIEHREAPTGPSTELTAVQPLRRRSFLVRALVGVAGVVGLAALAPISALARRREGVPAATTWQAGVRLVNDDGEPVRADAVPRSGLSRAWPQGAPRQELAAVFVVRLGGRQVAEPPTRMEWVVDESLIAYSKVCTHAGCPVALYQAERGQLFCPCHQASFDVARGAEPTFGPASRPLAQLPLGVDAEGYLVALGDFEQPVGPPVG